MARSGDLPPGPPEYSPGEWAEYHGDPCGFCIKELTNPDPKVRCNAAEILRGLASDALAAIPSLVAGLDDLDDRVRACCVHALVDIGHAVKERAVGAVPALTRELRASNAEIRSLAAHALAAIGPSASSAAQELRRLLMDPDRECREAASIALDRLEGTPR